MTPSPDTLAARAPLAPLRRIIDEFVNEHGVECERLECGHVVHRKQDIYGPTNAYRRRCRHCLKAQENDNG